MCRSLRLNHRPWPRMFALAALLYPAGLLLLSSPCPAAAEASPSGYHVMKKAPLGGEGGWDYLTVDPDAHRLYISHATHVVVADSESGAVVGDIPNTPGVHGIAFAPKLGRGFVSNGREGTVTIFDLKTLKELGRTTVGMNPDCIMFDPATERVFTFNGRSGDATALDAKTNQVVGTIPLGGRPEFAVSDEKGTIFVNIEDKSEIVALDPRQLTVLHRWSLAPGEGPSGLAIDRAHRRLFSVCSNQKMVILDADTGKVLATPTIGRGPDAAAFDPSRALAFSSTGQDGTLTVIHEDGPDRFTVIETVTTQVGAKTMALDPKTHRVFLTTAEVAPAAPGAPAPRRPAFVPGSFELLIVEK